MIWQKDALDNETSGPDSSSDIEKDQSVGSESIGQTTNCSQGR